MVSLRVNKRAGAVLLAVISIVGETASVLTPLLPLPSVAAKGGLLVARILGMLFCHAVGAPRHG